MAVRVDRARLARAVLLIGSGVLIGKLFATGEMVKYMTPVLDPLSALTGVVLGTMGAVELRAGLAARPQARGHDVEATEAVLTLLLGLLPVGLGLVVAPRALGSSALGGESVTGLLLAFASGPPPPGPAPPRTGPVLDTADLLAYLREVGEGGVGQRVRATGIVARSARLAGNEFALLRYAIAHCVADARPLALLVVAPADADLPADQWVAVEGVLTVREREGERLVGIMAERIVPVAEPRNPYLAATY